MSFKPHHYMFNYFDNSQGVAQVESFMRHKISVPLPESILRLAHKEYERQFPGQSYEHMQGRGGLGVYEALRLLADYVERLEACPKNGT